MASTVGERVAVRPFRIDVPKEDLVDLRRRVVETRWPDRETVSDRSQGVQLAKLQPLVEYWGTDYDWRKVEATLNELPQFITEIDGGSRVPAAFRRSDARPCAAGGPCAGGRAREPARRRLRLDPRVARHRGGQRVGRVPAR
jgi:hypothetical protein